jgi:Thiol:disulfide interchange protein DsbD, N-terminal
MPNSLKPIMGSSLRANLSGIARNSDEWLAAYGCIKEWKNSAMRLLAALLLLLVSAGAACAEGPPSVVSARVLVAPHAVHPGATIRIAVVAHIDSGYHINDHKPSLDYLIPTRVMFEDSPSLKVEKVAYPRGKLVKFVFLDSPISVYEGEIRLGADLKVSPSLKAGAYPLRGKLTYQACNDHACLPPTSVPLEALVRVAASSALFHPADSAVSKEK